MNLSNTVSYAVGILLQVLKAGSKGPVTATRISSGCKFPPRFLYRVLRRLVDAGLLTAVSGPGGGYTLAKKPSSITLFDILHAVEGPCEASRLTHVSPKHKRAIAAINAASERIVARVNRDLAKINLAQLGRA